MPNTYVKTLPWSEVTIKFTQFEIFLSLNPSINHPSVVSTVCIDSLTYIHNSMMQYCLLHA